MNIFKLSLVALMISQLTGCFDDGDDGSDGTNGGNGNNGLNSLIVQTTLSIGNAECRNGGTQINTGLDDNSDGTLDSAEIDETSYVCKNAITTLANAQLSSNINNAWYAAAEKQVENSQRAIENIVNIKGKGKNIILFVGDGMGVSTVTAARILDGQNKGMMGEENSLSFESMPFSGLAKTYNVDAQTPDSAGTMTAMIYGVKTDAGVIGVSQDVERGSCSTLSGNEIIGALELAEISGMSTGVVSTARITHATPAATYAKSPERNWEDISDMSEAVIEEGCIDIADQLVNFEFNLEAKFTGLDVDGIEVVFGGGRRHFLPNDPSFNSPDAVSATEGDRTDGRDLTAEWQKSYPQGVYVFDQTGFDAIDPSVNGQVFGLFNESHMQYEADRLNDIAGEPSLTEMTEKAIDILDNNQKGFFLMVESGRIDHAHHAGNAYNALSDTIELSRAVQSAMDMTNPEDTLIIVTADHSHVFTIAGYPKRGNPILGKVVAVGNVESSLASDGLPYTTLGYTNGRGFRNLGAATDADVAYAEPAITGRVDLSEIQTNTSGFHQEALVPASSETHAGEDVSIFASGPGSHLVNGTNEQNIIFHIMNFSADLVTRADDVLE